MRLLFEEIRTIFQKNKSKIKCIWTLDILSLICTALLPWVIANAIDGIIDSNYYWFIFLIVLELVSLSISAMNNYYDTKIYTKILEDEIIDYYETANNIDDSTLSARVNMIEDLTGFLEVDFLQIITTLVYSIGAIAFLMYYTNSKITLLALLELLCVVLVIFLFRKRIKRNIIKRKDIEEKEQDVLRERKPVKYRSHLSKKFSIDVSTSKIDVIMTVVINIVNVSILLLIVFTQSIVTAGLIVGAITYMYLLNTEILNIPEHYKNIINLIDTAKRIKQGEE